MSAEEKLSPSKRLWIGSVVLALAASGFVAGRTLLRPQRSIEQPIQFNHRLHAGDLAIDCSHCHAYYETSQHSGLPSLDLCLGCHAGGLTESPEEAKLLSLAEGGSPPAFQKLFVMPDHVYYSHRQHVALSELECETCHGDVAKTETPPPAPLVRVTMSTCVDCHTSMGVHTDCTHCHR